MKAVKSIPLSLLILILVSIILRCLAASLLGLGNDEVYYTTYAVHPAISHFDHPPMVGFLIQLTTLNLKLLNEFAMRLGPIILGTGSTVLIYFIGKTVSCKRTGLIAAYISTASIYLSVIGGTFIMPDTVLLFFFLLSFYFFLKYIPNAPSEAKPMDIWLSFIFFGLAVYSKYQACFLGFGILLYIILFNRKWFGQITMYIGTLIPLIFIGLIVYWNYTNKFAGTSFQSGRIISITDIRIDRFFREIGGEIAYYNPINIALIFAALFSFRKMKFIESKYMRFILCCSIPLIITVWFMALSSATLPHWVGISYILLFITAASFLDKKIKTLKFPTWYVYIMLTVAFIAIIVAKIGLVYPFGISSLYDSGKYSKAVYNPPAPEEWESELGRKDFTLDMQCWDQVNSIYKKFIDENPQYKNYPLIGAHWFTAAHIDFYVAMPNNVKLLMYGKMDKVHEYYWINKIRGELSKGEDAIYITTSHYFIAPGDKLYPYFNSFKLLYRAPVYRLGRIVEFVYIYKLENFKGVYNTL